MPKDVAVLMKYESGMSVVRSRVFEQLKKLSKATIFWLFPKFLDLSTLIVLHKAPPRKTAFQSWTNSKRLWSQQPRDANSSAIFIPLEFGESGNDNLSFLGDQGNFGEYFVSDLKWIWNFFLFQRTLLNFSF